MLFIAISILTLFLMSGSLILTPYMSRTSSQFGVTLPPDLQGADELKKILKNYVNKNIILTGCLVLPHVYFVIQRHYLDISQVISVYIILELLCYMILSTVFFLDSRKKVLQFKLSHPSYLKKNNQAIVVDTSFRKEKIIVPNWLFIVSNSVIILLVCAWTIIYYNEFPNQIVMNFDSKMQPSSFTDKTWASVFSLPVMQLFLMAIFWFSNYSFLKAKQNLSKLNTKTYRKNNQKFRYFSSVSLFVMAIMTQLLLAFLQFSTLQGEMNGFVFAVILFVYLTITIGATLYVSLKYGQSGERVHKDMTYDTYDDDDKWKLGMFYVNKQDPAIWVEKKYGVGTSLNFARWQSWLFVVGTVAAPIIIVTILM